MVGKLSHVVILTLCCVSLMLFLLIQAPASALVVSQQLQVNGTTTLATLYDDGFIPSEQVVYVNGIAYVNITYDDGSAGLVTLKNYIDQQQGNWSEDHMGIKMDDVLKAVDNAAAYRTGNSNYISADDRELLGALDAIAAANVGDFYNTDYKNLVAAVNNDHAMTQNNIYEIESIYITLEKMSPDLYCQSRMEVVKKYNLSAVKCGLHSKICYNGNLDKSEGGRDYCVHTGNDEDYLPCMNVFGRCGTLENAKIYESEVNSYTPISIGFYNPGNMTLKPNVKIEVWEMDGYAPLKTFEKELGNVSAGERKDYIFYLDNSGLEPNKTYDVSIMLSSGRKEILEKISYSLLPEGTFQREGTLDVTSSNATYGKAVEINATYINLAPYAYSTNLEVEVFLNNKRHFSFESAPFAVNSLEIKTIPLSYLPDEEGNYTLFVKAKDTDLKEKLQFEIEKPVEKAKTTGLLSMLKFWW